MPGRQCPPAMSGVCWTSVSGSCRWVQVRPWEGPLGLTRTLPEGAGSVPHGPAETSWHGGQQLGDGGPHGGPDPLGLEELSLGRGFLRREG